jgi:hypothetical protein
MTAGDTLVVPALDRLSRSLQDLITTVGELRRREVGFTSLHENLDTTTEGGRLVFRVFAALAEFIRELIVSGTREGLAAARARGRVGGRPSVVTPEIVRAARDMLPNPDASVTANRPATGSQPGHPLQPHSRPARAARRRPCPAGAARRAGRPVNSSAGLLGFIAGVLISVVTVPVGVSGAVFLLPVQLSVLGVPSPAVTPTNLLFKRRRRSRRAGPLPPPRSPGRAADPAAALRDTARRRGRRADPGLRRARAAGVPAHRRRAAAAPRPLAVPAGSTPAATRPPSCRWAVAEGDHRAVDRHVIPYLAAESVT